MSRPPLPVLKCLLLIALLVACVPAAIAASTPTLFSVTSSKAEVIAQGAQKSWPIKLNEESAFDAVFQGGMWLPNPAGGRIYVKYQRHIVHSNGTWTWIGTVSTIHGEQPVVLTFGKDGAFGLIPQASGYPLRIVTRAGRTRMVETSAEGIARSTDALRLRSAPDFVIPLRTKTAGARDTTSRMTAPDIAARAESSGPPTIDVMVAYTPGFVTELGSVNLALTRIQNLVDVTNTAYINSGVTQRIRLVHTVQVNYPDNNSNSNALDDITGLDANGNPVPIPSSLQGLAALRSQYGADLVSLIRSYDNATQDGCGIGWLIGGNQEPIVPGQDNVYGYSVVSDGGNGGYYCLDTTFAHELGHNMGNAHDRANAADSGAYSYSYGYVGNGENGFSTIMAYGVDTDTPLAVFSNPSISVCQNSPCGVADSSSSSADNAHSMNNTASLIAQFEPTTVGTQPPTLSPQVHNDVNGDGMSDLLVYNPSPARLGWWLMDGAQVLSYHSQGGASNWHVVATGDFNGDGKTDIVWSDSSNRIYIWLSNGNGFVSQFVAQNASGWTVVGAGDVNGDGDADLLVYNASPARLGWWVMNGATVLSYHSQSVNSTWKFVTTGDFNGYGMLDVVWTDPSSNVYLWSSTGNGFTSNLVAKNAPGWSIVGAGDVNGDGDADLLVYNPSPARLGWWLMNGSTVLSYYSQPVSSSWKFSTIGDFNGDGEIDVAWLASGKTLYFWMSNGSGFDASSPVGNFTTGWSIIP